jgi:hypothetical protein
MWTDADMNMELSELELGHGTWNTNTETDIHMIKGNGIMLPLSNW